MNSLTSIMTLHTMTSWEVKQLCQGCQHSQALRQPGKTITELAASTARICQSCNQPATHRQLYIVAIGTTRQATSKEKSYYTDLIGRIEKHCIAGHKKLFMKAEDRLLGLLIPGLAPVTTLTYSQRFSLLPADLRTTLDDFAVAFFDQE